MDWDSCGQCLQVVDDWDCLRTAINTWEEACGPLGQYGMKYSRLFANVCNLNVSKSHLRTENLKVACAKD